MHARPDRTTKVRRAVAAVAAVGAITAALASLLPWIGTDTEDGGTTSITGWGSISGTSSIAGTNLNDVMDSWTYRPGLIGFIFGTIGAVAAISLAANAGRTSRPHRITAAVLTLCGLVCLGWGVLRGIVPGDAGVFDAGETYAAIGPWVTAAGGAVMIAAAVVVFAGRIDPPMPTARRSIQPR
jgi:hypothetical protein